MRLVYTIREAKESDAAAVVALSGVLDDLHTAGAPHHFRGSSAVPRSEESILELVRDPDAAILVAEVESRVVGHVIARLELVPDRMPLIPRRYAQIHDLVVTQELRGNGLARALVRAAESWARAQGVDSVELTVWEFNEAARRLYEKLGYATQYRRVRARLPGGG